LYAKRVKVGFEFRCLGFRTVEIKHEVHNPDSYRIGVNLIIVIIHFFGLKTFWECDFWR